MDRVALYTRVSTEEQAQEGVSIDTQLTALRKWASDKGYQVVREYIDLGYSGRDDKRPQFELMILDAKQRKFDTVAVSKLDRFMRNLGKLSQRLEELGALGIGFVPLDYPQLDTSTAVGKMTLAVVGAVAEFESNRIGERISEGKHTRIGKGKWASGRTLYGYRWLPKEQEWQVIEEEANVVRYVYHLYVNQNLGSMKILTRLNSEGYRTRLGYAWKFSALNRILTHPAYKGLHYLGIKMPPIIDEVTWDLAQRKRSEARSIRKNSHDWLLQGMGICGLCSHTLSCIQKQLSKPRYYGCRGRFKDSHLDGSPCCQSPKIQAEWLEKVVWDRFATILSDSNILRQSINDALAGLEERQRQMEAGSEPINHQLEKVRGAMERYGIAFGDGTISEDRYRDKLNKLKKHEADLLARRTNLDPKPQLEVARLKEYINWIRELLDKGGFVVQDDGIWAYAFNQAGGIVAAENFGSGLGVEETIDRITCKRESELPITAEEESDFIKLNVWTFQNPQKARIKGMRAILQKFDTKVWAFPDRIEIRGFIPTQVIGVSAEIVRPLGGRDIYSASLPG